MFVELITFGLLLLRMRYSRTFLESVSPVFNVAPPFIILTKLNHEFNRNIIQRRRKKTSFLSCLEGRIETLTFTKLGLILKNVFMAVV